MPQPWIRRRDPAASGTPPDWDDAARFYDRIAAGVVRVTRLLLRLQVVGGERLPRRGPIVFAANHVSHVDPFVLATVLYQAGRQVRFLAVSDLFTGLRGWVLRRTGMIPVERGAGPKPMVRDALAAVAAGQSVLVYPEGTIPAPGQRLPAKPGTGMLALRANVPVIPVATRGLEPRPGWLPRLRPPCVVAFGDPVDLSAWEQPGERAHQVEAAEAILEAVRKLHAGGSRRDGV